MLSASNILESIFDICGIVLSASNILQSVLDIFGIVFCINTLKGLSPSRETKYENRAREGS